MHVWVSTDVLPARLVILKRYPADRFGPFAPASQSTVCSRRQSDPLCAWSHSRIGHQHAPWGMLLAIGPSTRLTIRVCIPLFDSRCAKQNLELIRNLGRSSRTNTDDVKALRDDSPTPSTTSSIRHVTPTRIPGSASKRLPLAIRTFESPSPTVDRPTTRRSRLTETLDQSVRQAVGEVLDKSPVSRLCKFQREEDEPDDYPFRRNSPFNQTSR